MKKFKKDILILESLRVTKDQLTYAAANYDVESGIDFDKNGFSFDFERTGFTFEKTFLREEMTLSNNTFENNYAQIGKSVYIDGHQGTVDMSGSNFDVISSEINEIKAHMKHGVKVNGGEVDKVILPVKVNGGKIDRINNSVDCICYERRK